MTASLRPGVLVVLALVPLVTLGGSQTTSTDAAPTRPPRWGGAPVSGVDALAGPGARPPNVRPPLGPTRPDTTVRAGDWLKREVMIPMRDGVGLHTEIYVPAKMESPLPLLLTRTPYGLSHDENGAHAALSGSYRAMARDGYIFVFQDIRGRYGSEGEFVMLRPPRDPSAGEQVDETTDTWDTIEWLLRNVEGHNGRFGLLGISYGGWLTVMGSLDPHPSLAAVSPQASPSDMFVGDDFYHYGAFRLAPAFGYVALMERSDEVTPYDFQPYDVYEFFLELGPLSTVNRKLFHGRLPTWNAFMAHPTYDNWWQRREVTRYLDGVKVPTLNVAGWWDAEDFYGPLAIYEALERTDTAGVNHLVVGPWQHGGWARDRGDSLGAIDFGSPTGVYFREQVQAPWFAHWLKGAPSPELPEALTFQSGGNQWTRWSSWPPREGVRARKLYLRSNDSLSWEPPPAASAESGAFDAFVSDPAHPVPYTRRPIDGFWQDSRAKALWKMEDQRFVHLRPDVLSYETAVLPEDVVVAGQVTVLLHASTTGTDADWVVKLIDVYPEKLPGDGPMQGYQLPVAGEVLRARFRNGYDHPEAVPAGEPVAYTVDLRDVYHRFRAGHRIMIQVQSSWFPLIDRNPQTFVPIPRARPSDYRPATHRLFRSRGRPSHVALPVATERGDSEPPKPDPASKG